MSSLTQEPGPHSYQKMISGKKNFIFSAQDYFEKDQSLKGVNLKNDYSEL